MTIKELLVVALFGLLVIVSPWGRTGSIPECGMDVNIVYQARKQGVPKEAITERANNATNLTEERRAFILKLIEDAYSKTADEFAEDAFPACGSKL